MFKLFLKGIAYSFKNMMKQNWSSQCGSSQFYIYENSANAHKFVQIIIFFNKSKQKVFQSQTHFQFLFFFFYIRSFRQNSVSNTAPRDSQPIRLIFSFKNIFSTLIFSFIIACFSASLLLIALPRDVHFSKMLWNSNLNVNFMNTRGEESGLRQNDFSRLHQDSLQLRWTFWAASFQGTSTNPFCTCNQIL